MLVMGDPVPRRGRSRGPLFYLLVGLCLQVHLSGRITYTLSFEDRAEHYVSVELEVDGLRQKQFLDLKMATWIPGSYLIRELARNVVGVTARGGFRELPVVKVDKNTWRVTTKGQRRIFVRYKLYAYEPTHRTSYVDNDMAMLNGASLFMYPVGMQDRESVVVINKPRSWKKVNTALPGVGSSSPVYRAANFDMLVDSPIILGNHTVLEFNLSGVPHRYAISGRGNYDAEQLVTDSKKIFSEIHALFGSIPYQDYTVFLNLRDVHGKRNGLEHLNSTHLVASRWTFSPEQEYRKYLELLSHEVFHAYNVKRIRPAALGPFDYDRENYTTLLWVAEGLTSYYDRLFLRRANLLSVDDYLDLIAADILDIESTPGRLEQSLQAASFDTWIEYYRQDENTPNTAISYYTKGSLVGLALDLAIRSSTEGERTLDDVFRALWQDFQNTGAGYTHEIFRAWCDSIAGRPLDDVFQYVTTTSEIDWAPILEPFGLMLIRGYSSPADSAKAFYGLETDTTDATSNRLAISRVDHASPAARAGLSVHDELIAIDGFRLLGKSAHKILNSMRTGREVEVIVNRNGQIKRLTVRPEAQPYDQLSIVKLAPPTDEQERLYTGWLQAPWE